MGDGIFKSALRVGCYEADRLGGRGIKGMGDGDLPWFEAGLGNHVFLGGEHQPDRLGICGARGV